MLIRNRIFSGERPKLSSRLLGENESTIALDCDLVSGELRPIKDNALIEVLPESGYQTLFSIDGEQFTWPGDVSVAETPVNAAVRRLFWTGDGYPRQAELDDLRAGRDFRVGIPKPVLPPRVTNVLNLPDEQGGVPITSLYRTTFVNKWGEEGDASDPSNLFNFQIGQEMYIEDLGSGDNVDLDQYAVVAYRLYRLSEGVMRFVAEYPLDKDFARDSAGESDLAEALSSEDFYLPPVNLEGLHIMANGIALGYVGNIVYVSEPYNPNAWPYNIELRSPVTGISSFDNNAVFLTNAYPEVAVIFDPRNLSTSVIAEREPCVARRGIVQGAGGVIYPAPTGLFYIGGAGSRMLTDEYMDEADWQALSPATFTAAFRDGEYIAFYDTPGNQGGWIFDLREPNSMVRRLSQWASAAYVAEGTDDMYLIVRDRLELYQAGVDLLTYCWRGKHHGGGSPFAITSRRIVSTDFANNPTAAELSNQASAATARAAANAALIAASTGPANGLGGAIGQSTMGAVTHAGSILQRQTRGSVTYTCDLTIWGDDDIIHSEELTTEEMDRIAYADRKRIWYYELCGNAVVTQFDMAGSFTEMHTGN